jgi:site-specific recombinase XerD
MGALGTPKGVCLMFLKTDNPRTVYLSKVDYYLVSWLEAFLIDRKSAGLADGSLRFYRQKLKLLADFCDAQAVQTIDQITPSFLRQYLLVLEETGHNAGGRHGAFRAMRAFFLWYEDEAEPEGWDNPIHKVKAPKVPTEPLEPVPIETVFRIVNICREGTFIGDRDTAILLCLLDTGARASEFLAMDLVDLDQARGTILIRKGKGSKPRMVYLGKKSRKKIAEILTASPKGRAGIMGDSSTVWVRSIEL